MTISFCNFKVKRLNREFKMSWTNVEAWWTQNNPIQIGLFRNVRNIPSIIQFFSGGANPRTIFIDPTCLVSSFHLMVALGHSYTSTTYKGGQLSREIMYNLSPSKHIKEAVSAFGINESTTNVLVIVYSDEERQTAANLIEGDLTDLSYLDASDRNPAELEAISNCFRLPRTLDQRQMENAVLSRISTKEVA